MLRRKALTDIKPEAIKEDKGEDNIEEATTTTDTTMRNIEEDLIIEVKEDPNATDTEEEEIIEVMTIATLDKSYYFLRSNIKFNYIII